MDEISDLSICEKNNKTRIFKKGNNSITKSEKIFDSEFVFGWNRFNLRMIGLWPDQTWKESQANVIVIYSPLIWSIWVFMFVVLPQALILIIYTAPLSELIEPISAVTGYSVVVMKIIILWYNHDDFARCLSFLTDDWTQKLSADDREIMMKNATLSRNLSIGVTILIHCTVWSYVLLQAWSLLHLNFDAYNSTELGKELFYPSYCPFNLNNPLNFASIWAGQCVGILCTTFTYAGTDGFVTMLIIHLCGQITILRYSLSNLIDDEHFQGSEIFSIKLRTILKRHNALIKISKMIKETVSLLLFVLILDHTFQLCCQLFRLVETVVEHEPDEFPLVEVFYLLTFLNLIFANIFIYCYVGEMLIQESQALGLATYSSKWYNLSSSSAKNLQLVMCRSSIPLQIWAGKFAPFSLELFGCILKTSMSYFSVLLTMKEHLAQ